MQHQRGMRVGNGIEHFGEQGKPRFRREFPRIAVFRQALTIDKFHRQKRHRVAAAAVYADLDQTCDVGMIERGENGTFARETFRRRLRIGHAGRYLYRDRR